MEASPSGGVPCEPGAVFFCCQCHPQAALLMLEQLGIAGIEVPIPKAGCVAGGTRERTR
jgi:hypothetical protein